MAGESLSDQDLCRVTGATVTMAANFLKRVALPNLFRLGYETMPEEGAPAAHARWIPGYILAHKREIVTAREIGRAYRPLRGKPADLGEAMAMLTDAGWIMSTEGRHDSLRWAVNPAVHRSFEAAATAERDRREQVRQALQAGIGEFTNASPEDLAELLNQGLSIDDAAAQLGISRATAYRWK
jgi:hypothetical protein